jgi:hypothetical protein
MAAPLTDIDQVRSLLGITGSGQDTNLQFLIDAASEMIREHTGRRFTEGRVEEARTLYPEGVRSVYVDELFAPADITSVVDEGGSALTYTFRPDTTGGRIKGARLYFPDTGLRVRDFPEDHSDWFVRNMHGFNTNVPPMVVTISGTFGWGDDLPADLRYVAARTVAIWYKGEIAHFASTFDAEMGRFVVPEKLPASVSAQLEDWRIAEFVAV